MNDTERDSIVLVFTQYVFAKVGICYLVRPMIQRVSGTVISINEAKAGDLLFWDRHGSTYHVLAAIGGDK